MYMVYHKKREASTLIPPCSLFHMKCVNHNSSTDVCMQRETKKNNKPNITHKTLSHFSRWQQRRRAASVCHLRAHVCGAAHKNPIKMKRRAHRAFPSNVHAGGGTTAKPSLASCAQMMSGLGRQERNCIFRRTRQR